MGWLSGIGIFIAVCGGYLFLTGMQKGPNTERAKNFKTYSPRKKEINRIIQTFIAVINETLERSDLL